MSEENRVKIWRQNESDLLQKAKEIQSNVMGIFVGVFDRHYLTKNWEYLKILKNEVFDAYKERQISKEGLNSILNIINPTFDYLKNKREEERYKWEQRQKEFESHEGKLGRAVNNFYNEVYYYDGTKKQLDKINFWRTQVYEILKKGVRHNQIESIMGRFDSAKESLKVKFEKNEAELDSLVGDFINAVYYYDPIKSSKESSNKIHDIKERIFNLLKEKWFRIEEKEIIMRKFNEYNEKYKFKQEERRKHFEEVRRQKEVRAKESEHWESKLEQAVSSYSSAVYGYDSINASKEDGKRIKELKEHVFEILNAKKCRRDKIDGIMLRFRNASGSYSTKQDERKRHFEEKKKEWEQRQKEKEEKKRAWEEEKARKKAEWEYRQRERERKQKEWEAEQARRKAEYEARQRERERKQREWEERQRERKRRQAEYEARKRRR